MKLPKLVDLLAERLDSAESQKRFQQLIAPYQSGFLGIAIFAVVDLVVLAMPTPAWIGFLEFPASLLLACYTALIGFSLFEDIFEQYLLGAALEDENNINTELLTLGKF